MWSNRQAASHFHPPHLHQTDELGVVSPDLVRVAVGEFSRFPLLKMFLAVGLL